LAKSKKESKKKTGERGGDERREKRGSAFHPITVGVCCVRPSFAKKEVRVARKDKSRKDSLLTLAVFYGGVAS
jgi:hypothetical protein